MDNNPNPIDIDLVPKLGLFDGDKIRIVRDLSLEEYSLYTQSTEMIKTFFKNSRLYQVLINSCSDIRDYLIKCENNPSITLLMDAFERDEILCNINGKLITCVSSFKAFLDQTGHYYSSRFGSESEEYAIFEKLRKDTYSENFSYRLFYELRNHIQHCQLPVNYFEGRKALLDKQQLINDPQVKASFRRELEGIKDNIELLPGIETFVDCIARLFGSLVHIELPALVDSVNLINKILLVGKLENPTLVAWIISKTEIINGRTQYTLEMPDYEYSFLIKQLEVLGNYDPLLTAAAVITLRKGEQRT